MPIRTPSLFASLPLLPLLALAACSSSAGDGTPTGSGTGATSTSSLASTTSTAGATTAGTGGTTTGGTGGASAGTGGTSSGTGGMPFTPGQPITAPADTWTWVPFDNAFCANGKSTGIGVNLSSTGSRALIYFEGGGACWSELTCYTLMTASYFTGYGESDFQTEASDTTYLAMPGGFFDRTSATNPFKDYSYVYIPYCTGDVFSGNNVVTYGSNTAHFVGYTNVTAFLERIVPTFPTADRVILAGSSAGGFGASFNWWQTQQAFGSVRVDLIDDSGTPMPADIEADGYGEANDRTAWNLAATLPPACTACKQSLVGLLGFYNQQYPDHRATLLSYIADSTLPSFFGVSEAQFEQGLNEDISMYFTASSPFKAFTVNASGHVLWFDPQLTTGGVTLQQFITQMVTDDAAWASAHP